AALPERPDDLHRLAEHTEPQRLGCGKDSPGDVLIQVLAGPEAEFEPSGHQVCRGRRGLCDDRRVVAYQRAGHAGGDPGPRGGLRYRTDGAPGKPGTPVVRDPREVVIADAQKR